MLLDADVAQDNEHMLNVDTSNKVAFDTVEDEIEDEIKDVIQDDLLVNHREDIVEDAVDPDVILVMIKTTVSVVKTTTLYVCYI